MSAPLREFAIAGASVLIYPDPPSATRAAADHIASAMRQIVESQGKIVLGLATGGTPIPIYERLAALHNSGELSFKDVTSYNLDEYYPISGADGNSYRHYMREHLFSKVDVAPNRAHVLDGTVPEAFADEHAAQYGRWIEADGGLDLQLLGIGRNGHIGFNEPSSLSVEAASRLPTRLVELHPVTIADAAKDFGSEAAVIRRALTVGVAPILASRRILILALGPNKADAVARALNGPITAATPASLLRLAPGKVTWMLDAAAAKGLE